MLIVSNGARGTLGFYHRVICTAEIEIDQPTVVSCVRASDRVRGGACYDLSREAFTENSSCIQTLISCSDLASGTEADVSFASHIGLGSVDVEDSRIKNNTVNVRN